MLYFDPFGDNMKRAHNFLKWVSPSERLVCDRQFSTGNHMWIFVYDFFNIGQDWFYNADEACSLESGKQENVKEM